MLGALKTVKQTLQLGIPITIIFEEPISNLHQI